MLKINGGALKSDREALKDNGKAFRETGFKG